MQDFQKNKLPSVVPLVLWIYGWLIQTTNEAGDPVGSDLYLLAVKLRSLEKQATGLLPRNSVELPTTEARLAATQALDAIAQQPGGKDAMRLQEPARRLQLIVFITGGTLPRMRWTSCSWHIGPRSRA